MCSHRLPYNLYSHMVPWWLCYQSHSPLLPSRREMVGIINKLKSEIMQTIVAYQYIKLKQHSMCGFKILFIIILCMWAHTCHGMYVEVRGQPCIVSSFLAPRGLQGSKSAQQACTATALPAERSLETLCVFLNCESRTEWFSLCFHRIYNIK